MRIRTIKPEFFLHDGLYEAEKTEGMPLRIAFTGLWCAADREGRFKWEARRLGVAILPYDQIDFSRVLDALTTRGFIKKYRVAGVWYGVIPSFGRHQVINNRESKSEIPPISDADELTLDDHADLTRAPRVPHASKEEGKGREGKGRDIAPAPQPRKRDEVIDALASVEFPDISQVTGSAWGRIAKALKDIRSVSPDVTPEEIKERARIYHKVMPPNSTITAMALSIQWGKCIPSASTLVRVQT